MKHSIGAIAFACMAFGCMVIATSAEAASCNNEPISVEIDVPSVEGYSVAFVVNKMSAKVRGYSTWNDLGVTLSSNIAVSGSRIVNRTVDYKMKCDLRRALKVSGDCYLSTEQDGRLAKKSFTAQTPIQGTKGDHDFGTLTVCEDLKPKQCVRNGAGFILRVLWYRQGDLVVTQTDEETMELSENAEPFAGLIPTLGVASCVNGTDNIAVLSIQGGKFASDIVKGAIVTAMTAVTGLGCAAAATTGVVGVTGCTHLASLAAAAGVVVNTTLPDVSNSLFKIVQPSNTHYTKVYNTIFNPLIEEGGEISY